jgi:GT2 family glycosyltransferase
MLILFSNIFLNSQSTQKFFQVFNSLRKSGNSYPNYNFLTLEKLDHINQQFVSFRNLPHYFRTHSIGYRITNPIIGLLRNFKSKTLNLSNKIITKSKNFNNRVRYVEVPNPVLDKFLKIAKKKIDPKLIHINNSSSPELSIIIPVYGKLDFLARCLHSIQKAKTELKYEVILVDDLGPDLVEKFFSEKKNGIKIYKNSKNVGFTNTCNQGAKIANGKYLCFLNSDTIVTDNWSDSLLNGFKLAKNVGIVGPRLIFEDGTLQESGGIVFSNGDAANIGRNESTDNSWFKYFKDVDYVSGAALTISSVDFKKIGGFDKRFTPAYYEDTSLCLDIRHKLKKRVVVNPLSSVIHHEGATNGVDESSGFKKFMPINKEKFVEKHIVDLSKYGESFANIWWDRDKYIKGNVLIIDQCIPTPNEDSGSKDMDNILRGLLNQNYRPHFFALSNRGETPESYGYYEKGVHCVFGKDMLQFKEFFQKYNSLYSLIIISRVNSHQEVYETIDTYAPLTKKIFYTVDLHHVRLEAEYNQSKSLDVLKEARKTKIQEIQAIAETDKTIVLSQKEKNYLINSHGIEPSKISIWPLIRSEFENIDSFTKNENPKNISFIGGFRHTPNIEAVKILEKQILPTTKEIFEKNGIEFPKVKVYGSNPDQYIKNLNNDLISYEGFIENEEDAFKNSKISIAPIPFGSGLKGKTLSSLLYKTPIVGTSFAFEGFHENYKNIMFESSLDAEDFSQKIYNAYISADDLQPSDWNKIIEDLSKTFSYSSFVKILKKDIKEVMNQ